MLVTENRHCNRLFLRTEDIAMINTEKSLSSWASGRFHEWANILISPWLITPSGFKWKITMFLQHIPKYDPRAVKKCSLSKVLHGQMSSGCWVGMFNAAFHLHRKLFTRTSKHFVNWVFSIWNSILKHLPIVSASILRQL